MLPVVFVAKHSNVVETCLSPCGTLIGAGVSLVHQK